MHNKPAPRRSNPYCRSRSSVNNEVLPDHQDMSTTQVSQRTTTLDPTTSNTAWLTTQTLPLPAKGGKVLCNFSLLSYLLGLSCSPSNKPSALCSCLVEFFHCLYFHQPVIVLPGMVPGACPIDAWNFIDKFVRTSKVGWSDGSVIVCSVPSTHTSWGIQCLFFS